MSDTPSDNHSAGPRVDPALQSDLNEARRRIAELEDLIAANIRHLAETETAHEAVLAIYGQEIEARQAALDQVKTSVSWRVTAPVRTVMERVKARSLHPRTPDAPPIAPSRAAVDDEEPAVFDGSTTDYARWLNDFPPVPDAERHDLMRMTEALVDEGPVISVLMPVYNPHIPHLTTAIRSVREQLYAGWELCIADDASTDPEVAEVLDEIAASDARITVTRRSENGHISRATNTALATATGDLVTFLDQDDVLAPEALLVVARALQDHPEAALVYSDEDKLDMRGHRTDPYHKPPFNHALLLAQNTVCHLAVFRRELVTELEGLRPEFDGAQDHDLVLRAIERIRPDQIHRIPRVLYHWRAGVTSTSSDAGAKPYARVASRRAVEEHLERTGRRGIVTDSPSGVFNRPGPVSGSTGDDLVSIVIPTRDRPTDLRRCVESIRERTTHRAYELIVVDNGTTDPDALAYLDAIGRADDVRVIRDERPFNYSRMNNDAVTVASGEFVLLLNNDTEVVSHDWLEQMLFWFQWDDVGTVGAKLLYPDGRMQHGGIVLGIGEVAGHAQKYAGPSDPGYFGRLECPVDVDGNTGACLLVRRSTYRDLGGLDEGNLAVAFNDVDLCLRVSEAGLRHVWTPGAVLTHHESASRGSETESATKLRRAYREISYMRWRWGSRLHADRSYNPNLTHGNEDFALAVPPRIPSVLTEWRETRAR